MLSPELRCEEGAYTSCTSALGAQLHSEEYSVWNLPFT
jgi:hypothetical protein